MKIKWLGHSSFLMTESTGIKVLTDPYDPEMVGYGFEPVETDVVTVSHGHADHNYTDGVKKSELVLDAPGKYEYNGIHITGVPSFHDDCEGGKRGKNVIYKFRMDGVNVCHMGDIGEPCSPELIERLLPVDVLMIPVGGTYTVDADAAKEYVDRLMPGIVIPMHYKIKHCELDIDKVDPFAALFDGETVTEDVTELELDRNDFDDSETRVVVFERQKA
ncbi:MAG: MBL fold metallo-hydrolase [Clostridia bacterium]|jgi:L-ascorbate metabolism protein UlaG (beta-lactamase superfamily)|nr:MBL fold metallo-hydrolase [Clostridia bacterium]